MSKQGIDVSKWQGVIDWTKIKEAGIKFAILREGYGKKAPSQLDSTFKTNYSGAKAAGIPVGAYHYSYASSVSDAIKEAEFCLENIQGCQLEYPVAFDIEDSTMLALSTRTRTDICKTFCEEIEKAGYYAMIYCNTNWLKNYLYKEELVERYDLWLAHWGVQVPTYNCGIWQYSETGNVSGITGNVDLDKAYKDYPTIIKNKGLNGWGKNTENECVEGSEEGSQIYISYTVVKGDSLWKIAEKFLGKGVRYSEIKHLNSLTDDTIYPGQILKINAN